MPKINANNVNLNYEQRGDGNTIVFLHGYTGSTNDWNYQIDTVSKKYNCIAIDHRGHGKSDAPSLEEDYSIKIFSEDVYALLTKLEIRKCCLVGHSMGGFISLQLVLDHPEIVRGLVLVDTSSGEWETAPGFAEIRSKLDELARNEGLEAAFEYDVTNNPVRIERFKKHPERLEISRQKVLNTSVDGYIYAARSFKKWPSVTNRLGEINVPTLIFLGEEDIGFIKASQILNESIRGSKLITIPDVNHSPHEEAPDIVNETLVPFLEEIDWS